jgi:tetratricopeptide (TPR) repeat protein
MPPLCKRLLDQLKVPTLRMLAAIVVLAFTHAAFATSPRPSKQISDSIRSELEQGRHALVQGDYETALHHCQRAMDFDPARVFIDLFLDAEDCFARALQIRRKKARKEYAKAIDHKSRGLLPEARDILEHTLRMDPDYQVVINLRRIVQQELDGQAEDLFKAALELETAGMGEQAIETLEEVKRLLGDSSNPLFQKANIRLRILRGE